MSAPFTYSIGQNRFDARPVNHEAEDLRAFARHLLSLRAPDKARAGYVAAAFNGDGRRGATNAAPCNWIALDADRISVETLPDWRMFLARYRGFGWPTASSTPEAPRERVILAMSETVERHQRMSIGELLTADVEHEFGPRVVLDRCTYRPEQPCFLPLQGAQPFYLLGDPLDVPEWLAQASPPPAPPPAATAEVVAMADARMRLVVQQLANAGMLTKALGNGRGYAMRCPWERTHSTADEAGATSTALLFPSEGNGWRGGFRCLHAHCAGRGLRELVAVLRRAAELSERPAA